MGKAVTLSNEGLLRATDRIGKTPMATTEWLWGFAHRNLSAINPAEGEQLAHEAVVFALIGAPDPSVLPRSFLESLLQTQPIPQKLTYYEMAEWQNLILALVQTLLSKRSAKLILEEVAPVLWIPGPIGKNLFLARGYSMKSAASPRLRYEGRTWSAKFQHHAARLLVMYAEFVRRCQGCQKPFLASRRNQYYCTPECQSLWNMRRKRGTLPERFGKRGRPRDKPTQQEKRQLQIGNHAPSRGGSGHGKKRP